MEYKNRNINHIVLSHTYREAKGYLASLSFRFNSNYDKKPHFFVDKNGDVTEVLPSNQSTRIFESYGMKDGFISIMLENLGYLKQDSNNDTFLNWKGEIAESEPFSRNWRGYEYWDVYPQKQIKELINLCKNICVENNINPIFIGHNTKINDINNFNGIITRSNFSSRHTDLNPSFDFSYFKKVFENE